MRTGILRVWGGGVGEGGDENVLKLDCGDGCTKLKTNDLHALNG